MMHNDTLQTLQECLEQCEFESESCQLDGKGTKACETKKERCVIECDSSIRQVSTWIDEGGRFLE